MRSSTLAISELLQVTSVNFLSEVFGQRHAFSKIGALPYLRDLPKVDELDNLYFALDSAGSRLGIVDGHAAPSTGTSLLRGDGRVRLDELHAAYRSGKTLLLTHLQNSHLGVARLARSIECQLQELGILLRKEVGANLFLTPPDSRGFDPHYDGHDVLILQLEGEKTWKVFDQLLEVPAGMEGGRLTPNELSSNCDVFELSPGNVLYLPRGRPHAAYTTEKMSLHLTLSIIPTTFSDLIAEEIKTNIDTDERSICIPQTLKLEISTPRMEELQGQLKRRWLTNLNTLPDMSPWSGSVTDDSAIAVQLATTMIVDLEILEAERNFEIRMPGTSVKLGMAGLEAVNLLLAGKIVSPADISLGGRSTESKVRFLKQLVDIGLATPVGVH